MAVVIEFYVPTHFRQTFTRDSSERGKLIEFCSAADLISEERATGGDLSAPRLDTIVMQDSHIDEEIRSSLWACLPYIAFVD